MNSQEITPIYQEKWWTETALALSTVVVIAFGGLAVFLSVRDPNSTRNIEVFVTARKQIGVFFLAWSFFASYQGSWDYFLTAQYTGGLFPTGFLGCTARAFSVIIPMMLVSLIGPMLVKKYPTIQSFSDFSRVRFGVVNWIIITLVMTFCMCIALLSEYSIAATFFYSLVDPGVYPTGQRVISRPDVYYLVIVAVVVAIYTITGGLKVSIITDTIQGCLTLIFTLVVWIYIAVRFREPLLQSQFNKGNLGLHNYNGGTAFASQALAVGLPGLLNEAIWQRVLASRDTRTLTTAALIGGLLAAFVAWIYGFGGILAYWSNQPALDPEAILTFFTLFRGNLSSGIVMLCVVMIVLANESSIDSYQNGINAALSTSAQFLYYAIKDPKLFKDNKSIKQIIQDQDNQNKATQTPTHKINLNFRLFFEKYWYRSFVIIINIILIPIGCQRINAQTIFSIGDLISCIFIVPQLAGAFISPLYYNTYHMFGICIVEAVIVHVYGMQKAKILVKQEVLPGPYTHLLGLRYTWIYTLNEFDFLIYLIPVAVALVGVVIVFSVTFSIKYRKQAKMENFIPQNQLSRKQLFNDAFDWQQL